MQTDALNLDFSLKESRPEQIRVRKRVKVKSTKRYKNNSRKQKLTNPKARNLVMLVALIFLLIAVVAGLFYVAYHYFPEAEVYPEYQPAIETTNSLE